MSGNNKEKKKLDADVKTNGMNNSRLPFGDITEQCIN